MSYVTYAVSALVSALSLGCAAGYLGYMRGIQTCDFPLIAAWYLVLPFLALLQGMRESGPKRSWSYAPAMVSPFVVLAGVLCTYTYTPVWKASWGYAGLSSLQSLVFLMIGIKLVRFVPRSLLRICTHMLWIVAALCLVVARATISRSIEYETVTVIRYRGQGLLNHKADDIHFSTGMRVGFVDGYEYPMLEPRNVQQAGYYDSTRRYWLRGPLLELLGKGYDLGNPPSKGKN